MLLSKILIGTIIGVILGFIIKRRAFRFHKGPSSTKIQESIYHDITTNKRYRFEPIIYVCPPSINVEDMEHSDDSASD
jgi:hypothetical protein